ncbi:MAG: glycerol-3-phosphate dehydrogenase [Boseongicola sp. SB0676_bin_33]|uniref:Glycerol-3-phosphate dehydrogenase n=1 Tax=Boseongicola sp. SB0664_bin_43 TaxID=2604844 RepID=A0A6B0Y1D4_9RHOB|nr:glycerol-3-phosphate dehydrogenase [Boseongicola sp. SB0664_bin_43]MYF88354.1 glycerol-3-phosphate dehydrogenase [Boseongicola sp. SB0676_bin_33]MYK31035.1 glycerol-3-phosphate dehydrogenase [Boseongicola sp. SB0670_bin_30]
MRSEPGTFDLFIIGGGINGCGIARDAAGRGLSVGLAEMNDLASGTSGASTKLFHGGLRYLEYFEFGLVREALAEREVLLRAMPHISWPMRFVLPYHGEMRFDVGTPASRLLAVVMPWMKGRRPAWLIRTGLFLYDHLGGRRTLPGTATLDLDVDPAGEPLDLKFRRAFEYSDCWVQDARLVVLNARDAAARGARIMTRTRVLSAERADRFWRVTLEAAGRTLEVRARMLVNAGGPWVDDIAGNVLKADALEGVRLVRGSHVVTRRLFSHEKCYFFQGTDGRIIFAIPYEDDFTLIGTTDEDHDDPSLPPVCTPEEQRYLLEFASRYLKNPVTASDVVWTYAGVRPLLDDGAASATAATRGYVLKVDDAGGAPILSVHGGKITTYRKLAEAALAMIAPLLGSPARGWTAGVPLPGGDLPVDGTDDLVAELLAEHPFLSRGWARRLARTYGTESRRMLSGVRTLDDMGQDFGESVTALELDWVIANEWVMTAEDYLWRRTKLGLRVDKKGVERIEAHIESARTRASDGDRGTRPRSAN